MIIDVLEGRFDNVEYEQELVFGLYILKECFGVFFELFNFCNIWVDKDVYDCRVNKLVEVFINNFCKFEEGVDEEMMVVVLCVIEMV